MSSLCFGSYASLFKNAINKPNADNFVVPLLFGAIDEYYRTGSIDNSDCSKWKKAKLKLPNAIASPVNPIDPKAVEAYFATTVLPKITDENKRRTFHQYLYSLIVPNANFKEQEKSDLIAALIKKNYSFFNSQIFLYAITQSNIKGVSLDDLELLSLPEAPKLEGTLRKNKQGDTGFDRVFAPVSHNETLNLCNSNFIKLFRLDVANNKFVFENLNDFLKRHLYGYILSRAERDKLIEEDQIPELTSTAIEHIRKACNFNNAKIGEELGDLILYILLEHLNAPKVYNKIELTSTLGISAVNQGGVHLFTLEGTDSAFQVIVAKSNIKGNLRTAIDNAFSALVTAEKDLLAEYKLLDSSVLDLSFKPEIAEYLRGIIIPTKRKTGVKTSNAFGIFLGYSLGLDGAKYKVEDYLAAVEAKMAEDIKNQIAYIAEKIADNNLGNYSFYFYLIPFNNADCEKITIMQNLVGGDT